MHVWKGSNGRAVCIFWCSISGEVGQGSGMRVKLAHFIRLGGKAIVYFGEVLDACTGCEVSYKP